MDSSPTSKKGFLHWHLEASKDAITPQNIKAGWRTTEFWPLNMAKPLMSRQVVEPKPSGTTSKEKTTQDLSTCDLPANEHL